MEILRFVSVGFVVGPCLEEKIDFHASLVNRFYGQEGNTRRKQDIAK